MSNPIIGNLLTAFRIVRSSCPAASAGLLIDPSFFVKSTPIAVPITGGDTFFDCGYLQLVCIGKSKTKKIKKEFTATTPNSCVYTGVRQKPDSINQKT